MHTLLDLLVSGRKSRAPDDDGFFTVPADYLSPGYLTALAARARIAGVPRDQIDFGPSAGYLSAVGWGKVVYGEDDYQYTRRNVGTRYSPLTALDSPEGTDSATEAINGCIRENLRDCATPAFVAELCSVVGDLHDNVWSHGNSPGISMAQVRQYGRATRVEFGLADCGIGFRKEMARVGIDVGDDLDAIEWCIQEGNSTKKDREDDWAQALPPDIVGNPIPGIGSPRVSDNHHMGLGLAKLVSLVQRNAGELVLASGRASLNIRPNGDRVYVDNRYEWQGVALACTFDSERIARLNAPSAAVRELMDRIRGKR